MKFKKENIVYPVLGTILVVSLLLLYNIYKSEEKIEKSEWAYEITQLRKMNAQGFEGNGVVVGIVDTGIDAKHVDLDHIKIIAWKDYINNKEKPYDDDGHGTHVAGIICADGKLKGGAKEVSLIVVKAIDRKGKGTDEDVADAIDFCVEKGADIICLSLGGNRWPVVGSRTENACKRAIDKGVFVVAAAGNDGKNDDGDVASPANVEYVIAVGAVDKNKKIAPFSSKGNNTEGIIPGYQGKDPILGVKIDPTETWDDPNKKPELVAPGVDICSTWKGNSYAKANGTSQAVPFVCSAIALILDDDALPQYRHDGKDGGSKDTIKKFKNEFMNTAQKLDNQDRPHDDHYGYGLIQAYEAYLKLKA